MKTRPQAVVLASGGLDSCVAAAVAREDYDLAFCHANYGQRTVHRELTAFRAQAAFFEVDRLLEADLSFLGQIGGSSLTDLREKCLPYRAEATSRHPLTDVPFLDSLFLAAATAWAETLGPPPSSSAPTFSTTPATQTAAPPITTPSTVSSPWAPAPGLTSRSKHPSSNSTRRASCVWASSSKRLLSLPGHAM